ncbi:MAG: deoxyuridine 5'-triphosphate nucleotidohydrolase [Lachnospiraceae bacterium]|nr:deoxyuridine 5'-triphosphate nucleotidohydrolase [Candidatus Equihabitans merdae]
MHRVAEFQKVSFDQFKEGYIASFGQVPEDVLVKAYDMIKLPRRATKGSAGYDFCLTKDITLNPGETVKIPTGIRALMEEDWVLMLFPRSGLGFKFRLQLNNTVGVIDSDYAGSDNEGHIFVRMTNDSNEGKVLSLKEGDAFVQGVFLPYGITHDDDCDDIRNGGMGSTSK